MGNLIFLKMILDFSNLVLSNSSENFKNNQNDAETAISCKNHYQKLPRGWGLRPRPRLRYDSVAAVC